MIIRNSSYYMIFKYNKKIKKTVYLDDCGLCRAWRSWSFFSDYQGSWSCWCRFSLTGGNKMNLRNQANLIYFRKINICAHHNICYIKKLCLIVFSARYLYSARVYAIYTYDMNVNKFYRIMIGGCFGGAGDCFSLIIIGAGGGGVGG